MEGAAGQSGSRRALALGAGLALACLAALLAAAPALAWRQPSHRERHAIARAVRRTEGGAPLRVHVGEVRVSTAGPWASAGAALYQPRSAKPTQTMIDTLYRTRRGAWLDVADFRTPERQMPTTVERDLGLAPKEPFGGVYFELALLLGWLFGLVGIVDALLQPRSAFRAVERSKWRWFAIELAGALPLAGLVTWPVYSLAIRPQVYRAGGNSPRSYTRACFAALRVLGEVLGAFLGGLNSGQAPPRAGTSGQPQPPRPCPAGCQNGRRFCERCGSSGSVKDEYGVFKPCPACGGNPICFSCGGSGYA